MQFKAVLVLALALMTGACSSWVYRIDIPQGNYLDQKDVDKLRIQMTKEQVAYVLGNPVARNAFDDDKWHYVYRLARGNGSIYRKQLVIQFDENDKLTTIEGDFEPSEMFSTPLDQ